MIWIERANLAVARGLMVFAAFLAFSLAFYILVDVIARNLNMPIQGTSEVVTELIVTIVFLQISYCVATGGMLRADFLVKYFNRHTRRFLNIAGYSLGILFFATVFIGNIDPAIESWVTGEFEGEGALHMPTFPARFGLVIGCSLAAFSYALLLVREILMMVGVGQSPAAER
jgi:TRAP-type C4-dicarboxylate transport system permease small subunit